MKQYPAEPDLEENFVTSIRGYGFDINGNRICLQVEDFQPSVYIEAHANINFTNLRFTLEEKTNLYNFKNTKQDFFKVYFRTKSQMTAFLRENALENIAHEQNASSLLQFLTQQKLSQVGWLEFDGVLIEEANLCDKTFECIWTDTRPETGPFVEPLVCAFDCEVYSTIPTAMPSDKPGDEIFQISAVFSDGDEFLISLEGADYDDDVIQCSTERILLQTFMSLIKTKKPTILIGYNILGFDIEYILKRCTRLFLVDELLELGYGNKQANIKAVKWSSDAIGIQELTYIQWEGIVVLDLYPIVKRDYKFDNYKLETVAQAILGCGKDLVGIKDIIAAYDTKLMKKVGDYCVKDSRLCLQLEAKMATWIGLVEMANVCNVQPMTLYIQGQQIKIYSQVYKYCHFNNIVVNTNAYKTPATLKYSGAYVMEPVPGIYTNVIPFDFSSLYPSIIITENICYSTIADENVPDEDCNNFEWEDHIGCEHDPKVIAVTKLTQEIKALDSKMASMRVCRDQFKTKVEKQTLQLKINRLKEAQKPLRKQRAAFKAQKTFVICAKNSFRFLKSCIKVGVIPTIIQNLLSSRNAVKKLLKSQAHDEIGRIILDKKQLAYKISANSMYGAMGVRSGYLPYMPGAMTVTYCGREAIKKSLRLIEEKFGGKVIYGDTDSNYVQFKNLSLDKLWDHAQYVSKQVSAHFPKTMSLEFEEKIYKKFILLGKKKYVYTAWDTSNKVKLGFKGVVLARRDNAKIVRHLYNNCLNDIMMQAKTQTDIIYLIIDCISRLGCSFSHDEFVLTKSVGDADGEYDYESGRLGNYKVKSLPLDFDERERQLNGKTEEEWYTSQLPGHMQLVKKLARRGIPVAKGSRLEIVILNNGKVKLGEKMEDLDHYINNKWHLKLDYKYYITSMINPLDQLLEVVYNKPLLAEIANNVFKKTVCLAELRAKFKPKLIFIRNKCLKPIH
uniref:DNA-directed DNA polymerase n=1 Tax=Chrysiptera rollandi iridovirus TaxID=3156500 RepID=A0AAU7BB56_9VIRU